MRNLIRSRKVRYLGNKDSILTNIRDLLDKKGLLNKNLTFFDAFCGTGSVANEFKSEFKKTIINDNLKWATVYSYGRLISNKISFENLKFDPFVYFNESSTVDKGFFYLNYSPAESDRMYFTIENAGRIDFFRNTIEQWWNENKINESEYHYLLSCLIESVSKVANTAGVYGAFLKHWDSRALKPIEFIKVEKTGNATNEVESYNSKIESIISDIDCDVLYLDPPYTQNQYGTQYHLLETLVLYDNPSISKITGSRNTSTMRSDWSKNYKSHILLDYILANTKARYVVFSYNNDGFMSKDFIEASLRRYGKLDTYICKKIPYKKYKNWKSKNNTEHFEYLFFVELKEQSNVRYESPLNYIGSKAKVIGEIIDYIPKDPIKFFDIFGGGFNVGINVFKQKIVFNDINYFVKELIESFKENDTYDYLMYIRKITKKFGLEKGNKKAYLQARSYYNSLPKEKKDSRLLFTLILYGFQQQIRFNNSHEFNNPVGMRWFNDKILEKMISFSRVIKEKNCEFYSNNYIDLEKLIDKDSFVYLDPPYMLTTGAYNDGKRGFNGWNEHLETELFHFLDTLSEKKIMFMLSYVIEHKGEKNYNLIEWIKEKKYTVIELGDILGISGSRRKEVLIINYDKW